MASPVPVRALYALPPSMLQPQSDCMRAHPIQTQLAPPSKRPPTPTFRPVRLHTPPPHFTPPTLTPLHQAAASGQTQKVAALLKEPDTLIDHVNNDRRSALHLSAGNGAKDTVELLLNRKASVESRDLFHWTPLFLAVRGGHLETAELLLRKKANPNARDLVGNTPLHEAVGRDNPKIVELLLQYRAKINATNTFNQTPLHRGVDEGSARCLHRLLQQEELQCQIADDQGRTACKYAKDEQWDEMAQLLQPKK